MSRTELYERQAAAIVDEAVSCIRNRGLTRQNATQEAARWLGIKARRVHSLLFGEPTRVDADELADIRGNYLRLLDDEARDLERRAAQTRAKIQELRGYQHAETETAHLAAHGGTVPNGSRLLHS